MPVLVIDTCLAACQVGLFGAGRMLAGASEPMERGHQERLAPMAQEVLNAAGAGFDRIAVTVGPGSFTGLRVGLAFAKGLRLATGMPLVGLGTLHALAASANPDRPAAGVVDARRGLVYMQAFDAGRALTEPEVLPIADAARQLQRLHHRFTLVGSGAHALAGIMGGLADALDLAAPNIATLGALAEAATPGEEVRPLYLRAPDAKLPASALPA